VVFLGSLVAIMTQWLNARMLRLERGLTPVARRNHIVVLGWTNRTEAIVRELLISETRVRHFLRRRGVRTLHLVVLAGEVTAHLVQDLRDAAGDRWDERRVTLRSGSPLRPDHLARVDAANAAAIIVPAAESGDIAGRADSHTVKALLSLDRMRGSGPAPYVVTEVFHATSAELARQAYRGPLEVLVSDAFVSRLLAQNLRHPRLSEVYNELLSNEFGNEIYVRDVAELAGGTIAELRPRFPAAVLLGVVRANGDDFETRLNPEPDMVVSGDDRLVLIAHSLEDTEPAAVEKTSPEPASVHAETIPQRRTVSASGDVAASTRRASSGAEAAPARNASSVAAEASSRVAAARDAAAGSGPDALPSPQRLLLLGWNHKVPALVAELATYVRERFDVKVVSTLAAAHRTRAMRHVSFDVERVGITHVEANFTHAADLAALAPHEHDAIVLLGSDRLETHEESDARTLMGYLVLERLLPHDRRPPVLIELLDPENIALLQGSRAEVMISPMIVSHMLAQIALRRELRAVFDDLFTAGGAEVYFHPASRYVHAGSVVGFAELQASAAVTGETAIGVRGAGGDGRVRLNPDRAERWSVDEEMEVVVLASVE
jgi:ion channel POLLUX/CASTOR